MTTMHHPSQIIAVSTVVLSIVRGHIEAFLDDQMCVWRCNGTHWICIFSIIVLCCQNWSRERLVKNFLFQINHSSYFPAIVAVFSELLPHLAALRASVILHKTLLQSVFHAPLRFFDSTPMGRILARFSKDIDVVDNAMPHYTINIPYLIMQAVKMCWQIEQSKVNTLIFQIADCIC